MLHLLRYQGIAVRQRSLADGFTLDALSKRIVDPVAEETGAFLTFAHLRFTNFVEFHFSYIRALLKPDG
jgi:hypothetical protein